MGNPVNRTSDPDSTLRRKRGLETCCLNLTRKTTTGRLLFLPPLLTNFPWISEL